MSIYHRNHPIIYIVAVVVLTFEVFYKLGISMGTFIYAAFLVLAILIFLANLFFVDLWYSKYSTSYLPQNLVVNSSTIKNRFCTIILTPNEKIVVMDNDYWVNNSKRMFTVSKTDVKINKTWNKICKAFDENSSLDSMANFLNFDTIVNVITFATRPIKEQNPIQNNVKQTQKVEKNVAPKDENIVTESVLDDTDTKVKVDVNRASAEEIATLPGINIVGAKKLIEYRNTKGSFKTKEEFIKVASVKDYFVSKVNSLIEITELKNTIKDNQQDEDSRIVDL